MGSEKRVAKRDRKTTVLHGKGRDIRTARVHKEVAKGAGSRTGSRAQENAGNRRMTKNRHRGQTLDSFLKEEGIYDELKAIVTKEAIVWQLQQAMAKKRISKKRMAELMDTSRTQIDRILDPRSGNLTLETLQRAASIVGRELKVELV
jgi:hypothetical protein